MRAFVVVFVTLASVPAAATPEERPRPRGIYEIVPIANAEPTAGTLYGMPMPKHRILYMNRYGITVSPGMPDNSSLNISSIPQNTSTIPPFPYSTDLWNQVMDCVRDIYAPFNITVTEEDPGTVPHIESVVGGQPSDIGRPPDVGGIAPAAPGCDVVERAIVYTFDVWGQNVRDICETVAQESAHAFGLDHEFLCIDPMTYLFGCGPKAFQDVNAECGEFEPRLCKCGGTTQNSVQMLLSVLGEPDHVFPTTMITAPPDGATVDPRFHVLAEADDDVQITAVELWIDGQLRSTLAREPFDFETPGDLSFGAHVVEVRAVDFGGNVAIDTVNVTVEAECDGTSGCADGEECSGGVCLGALSSPCDSHDDCASATCARNPEGDLGCTTQCTAGDDSTCPSGFACGMQDGLCWPAKESGGGCAATGRGATSGALALLLFAALLVCTRRKLR